MEHPLIILTGPTAVGKTALSIRLAERVGGEIISADSMQVYRHMDIGSAKVTKEEMKNVPHHLIDVLDPSEEFNVVLFQKLAREAVDQIESRGHIPIVVGGTGFYIQALLYDVDFTETEEAPELRRHLEKVANEEGPDKLHAMLSQVDPVSAEAIHANNVKRVIRALEFYRQTGKRISEHNEEQRRRQSPYNFLYFVVTATRDLIYERIDERVDRMIEAGLVDEVKRLRDMGCTPGMVSMQGLGYKEIFSYLEGKSSLEDAVYVLKRDTRHFAKRQLTWFKRERDVEWISLPDFENDRERILDYMVEKCRSKKII